MKLIIQIPCYNEGKNLPITLNAIPKEIDGIDEIDILVIDDGSTDRTVEVAKEHGVKSFVYMEKNSGYGSAFSAGLKKAIELGADIIVNTDGDNQYCADDIEKLVKPIIDKQADIVIGERPILKMKQFSFVKKCFQKIGTFVVRMLGNVDVKDATSGFRAISSNAVKKLNIFENYSPMQEMLMQISAKNLVIKNVPVRVNADLRPSKLMKSIYSYMFKQAVIIYKNCLIYHPFRFFLSNTIFSVLLSLIFLDIALSFVLANNDIGYYLFLFASSITMFFGVCFGFSIFLSPIVTFYRKMFEKLQQNN